MFTLTAQTVDQPGFKVMSRTAQGFSLNRRQSRILWGVVEGVQPIV